VYLRNVVLALCLFLADHDNDLAYAMMCACVRACVVHLCVRFSKMSVLWESGIWPPFYPTMKESVVFNGAVRVWS